MTKTIGGIEHIGPLNTPLSKEIKSNGLQVCLQCGVRITLANDSGWEGFLEDGVTTQPLCISCNDELNKGGPKADMIYN